MSQTSCCWGSLLPSKVLQMQEEMEQVIAAVNTHPLRDHDRLTVLTNVYYEQDGEAPHAVATRVSKLIGTKEQPYQRKRLQAHLLPSKLDYGWFSDKLDQIGMVLIENMAGANLNTIPTEEEKKRFESQTLWLGHGDTESNFEAIFGVRSGLHCHYAPFDPERLRIQGINGPVPYTITVYGI